MPPFKSKEDAISWIKKEAETEPNDALVEIVIDKETQKNLLENHLPLSDPVTEKNPITIKAIGIRSRNRETIGFPGKDDWVERLYISNQGNNYWASKLARLKAQAKNLSKITGWQESQALIHILTGKIPILPQTRTVIKDKGFQTEQGWMQTKYATVTFFNPFMTREDLIKLHTRMRENLGIKHKKKQDKALLELVDFVKKRAKNHQYKDSDSFWQGLSDEWVDLKEQEPIKGASFNKRYSRACQKLGIYPIRFTKRS